MAYMFWSYSLYLPKCLPDPLFLLYLPNFVFCFLKPTKSNSCCANACDCEVLLCGVVDLVLEKTDSPSSSSQQLPVTLQLPWDYVPNSPLFPGT